MIKQASRLALVSILLMTLAVGEASAQAPRADPGETGGVNLLSVLPHVICVGDTVKMTGAASIELPDIPGDPPLAPLPVINLKLKAQLGQVTPAEIIHSGDFTYFDFTYRAVAPGQETVTAVLDDGVATAIDTFKVQAKCDYDVFLTEIVDFTADAGDFQFHSLSHVTGMGQMKLLRDGEPYLQGTGRWDLEENVLSKPPDCVQSYIPPLTTSGPFELDGKITPEDETLQVILAFQPHEGAPVYHGKSICVDADGSTTDAWSYGIGGDPALAAKIQTELSTGGGSRQVEMTGGGLDIVRSTGGQLDYTAVLTVVPR